MNERHDEEKLEQLYWEFDAARKSGEERLRFKGFMRAYANQFAAKQAGEPVAWVRRHPDGAFTNDFLEHEVIEPVRKKSGAWVPLYTRPTPEAVRDPVVNVLEELDKATAKFPTWPTDPLHAVAVLGEEFGELTKAVLQHTYEPHKSTADDVRTEAIQTAAMALRFLMSLDRYQYQHCEQHKQGGDHASN